MKGRMKTRKVLTGTESAGTESAATAARPSRGAEAASTPVIPHSQQTLRSFNYSWFKQYSWLEYWLSIDCSL